jgi:hypothetical protein
MAIIAVAAFAFCTGGVQADHYGDYYGAPGYSGGYRYSGPIYHPPSVHYDRVYHPEYTHWTPGRGLHTHGHYHVVPHYVPGHFDYQHGNHVHRNPYYHH